MTEPAEWQKLLQIYLDDMQTVIKAHYRPDDSIPQDGRASLTEQERNCVDGFQRFTEITSSLQALDLILILAQQKPRGPSITPMEALRFYIEAYLQEMYILRERLVRWLRFERKHLLPRSDGCVLMKAVENEVTESFKGPNALRSAHVHEVRHDTENLQWASALELITRTRSSRGDKDIEEKAWRLAAAETYKQCRREFVKEKKDEREVIERLLNHVASVVTTIIEPRRCKVPAIELPS
jgi:hypothetical protein